MQFSKAIINWYSIHKRILPWRNTKDPYKIWLSEIILQQTRVKQGLPYYKSFVNKYPSVHELSNASEEEILKLWQGLGYYSRARNLLHTAQYISKNLNGKFPNTYKGLIELKGVGDYTASAIASISYNQPTAVVDGNVYRVLSRYFGIDLPINSTKGKKEFKILATKLIAVNQPAVYNQAIMEFGALQCIPKNPKCNNCPLNDNCIALKKKLTRLLPIKQNNTKITIKYFNFLVCIDSQNHVVFEKRHKKGIWQKLYQFPLVETEYCLKLNEFKVLNAEKFLKIKIDNYYLYNAKDVVHKLSHQHLYTKFWILKTKAKLNNAISVKSLSQFPIPILISDFLKNFNFETV